MTTPSQTGLLSPLDLVKRPARFFEAHRMLVQHSTRLGPGFGIRFTVQFNLFGGTVVGLGTEAQVMCMAPYDSESSQHAHSSGVDVQWWCFC